MGKEAQPFPKIDKKNKGVGDALGFSYSFMKYEC